MPEFTSTESLMVWLINFLADNFPTQAILKGGMELRLLNCPRSTNDLDYTFIPFQSKKDIEEQLMEKLTKIPDLSVTHALHSTCLRIVVTSGNIKVQLEINAAMECKSQELSTSLLAENHNQQGRIIRGMSFDVSLSHKLAAWLERGLMRDLYDIYFIKEVLLIDPEIDTLKNRLKKIRNQKKSKLKLSSLNIQEFCSLLIREAKEINSESVNSELQDILSPEETAGLDLKMRKALTGIVDYIQEQSN